MSQRFNADEIFEIAEQIERNGAKFYCRAAEGDFEEDCKQKLLELAEMEIEHEKTFAAMRTQLSGKETGPTVFDPYGEAALYLQAMANGYVFDVNADPSENLAGKSVEEIFKTAIGLEKDSIVFYLGIKDMVPERFGRDKIDKIIREEMGHITLLSDELAALSR
jgi:rubrerythrin